MGLRRFGHDLADLDGDDDLAEEENYEDKKVLLANIKYVGLVITTLGGDQGGGGCGSLCC